MQICKKYLPLHSQSARDVYYRFTLHYKKENLVAERNLGDFFYYLRLRNPKACRTPTTWKILIDNGHGLNTPGKRSPDRQFLEAIYNREIAKRIVAELQNKGYDAELLVPEEEDISLNERVRRANEHCQIHGKSNVILISIHVNAAGNDSVRFPLLGQPAIRLVCWYFCIVSSCCSSQIGLQ